MKLPILTIENQKIGQINLPRQFEEAIYPNLIKKATLITQANKKQPKGANPEAGKRSSVYLSGRRKHYKTRHGKGISRIPRKTMSRSGTQFNWVGAFAPGTVGGRRAHPPKAEENLSKKINKKENRKAIRSAISATLKLELVEKNHKPPKEYPFVAENKFETLKKTKEVVKVLENWGLKKELERTKERKIKTGNARRRGRKYQTKTGPIIIVSQNCDLIKSARNIRGFEVMRVDNINVEKLSTGTKPGRMALFTQAAIEKIQKENLYQ